MQDRSERAFRSNKRGSGQCDRSCVHKLCSQMFTRELTGTYAKLEQGSWLPGLLLVPDPGLRTGAENPFFITFVYSSFSRC